MLKNHERFFTAAGKRLILIVDDELVNREILSFMLQDKFDVITAADGKEALDIIRDKLSLLSLVLTDIMMPEMDGFELLDAMKADASLRRIPVIVLTSDRQAEVKSLSNGASDFIAKPYNQPEVILARIQKTIELAEDQGIIQSTERDPLTGLLNREFFFKYVEQFDLHHPGASMDAVEIDINHFRLINEIYGWAYGDKVLNRMGTTLVKKAQSSGGIVGRKDADKFLFYAPHDTDYEAFLKELTAQMGVGNENARMHIRLGIFSNADAEPHIELRFDRAKMAGDHIKNDYSRQISYYDQELFSKELFDSQLMDDFERGLKEKQFEVWYQPKFDVKGDKPRLSSAECLIRWRHPKFGMVSPGVFIPLFERSGLIQRLDRYVWEEAARQVAQWRDSYGFTLPVSVNVSRIDMYAPDFVEFFTELMKREKLSPETYFIEITESAYTQDSDQMAAMVTALRDQGFKVEMDDFGSGYSSLNMLANLPIDFIKMDMQFVRSMDVNKKSLRMIELILDIASYLQLPVIAEGVETEQQVKVLKELGCYIIQGYYFSKPLPAAEFEKFIKEAKENA